VTVTQTVYGQCNCPAKPFFLNPSISTPSTTAESSGTLTSGAQSFPTPYFVVSPSSAVSSTTPYSFPPWPPSSTLLSSASSSGLYLPAPSSSIPWQFVYDYPPYAWSSETASGSSAGGVIVTPSGSGPRRHRLHLLARSPVAHNRHQIVLVKSQQFQLAR
jgi:hypothetical protein